MCWSEMVWTKRSCLERELSGDSTWCWMSPHGQHDQVKVQGPLTCYFEVKCWTGLDGPMHFIDPNLVCIHTYIQCEYMVHKILFDNPTTAIMSSIVTFREEKEVKFQCLLPILLQFENEKNICISYLTLGR